MLVSMDLSNPLIHDKVAMMVIDTAFKELYTPVKIELNLYINKVNILYFSLISIVFT
jgi:hypothetical protein